MIASDERRGAAPDGRDFAEWNESMVERYDIEAYYEKSHPIVRWVERRRLRALDELAAAGAADRVLEVGCGAGHVLARFAGRPRVGIDLSTTMLERAAARLGPQVDLLRGSADRLPFEDASFDVVLCTEVLEHVPDPAAVLRELMRVARPDARVVVSVPNEANIDRAKRLINRFGPLRAMLRTLASEGNEWHLHHFDLNTLEGMLAGVATIRLLRAVPARLMPLRYVASLAPSPQRAQV